MEASEYGAGVSIVETLFHSRVREMTANRRVHCQESIPADAPECLPVHRS